MLAREAPRSLAVPRDVKRVSPISSFPSEMVLSEWPLPIRDVTRIDTELVRVVFAFYLLVKQKLPNIGSSNVESWDPVDRVDRQAEAIRLVLDRQLQRRVDISHFLVAAYVDVVLTRPAIGEPVNKPRIGMEVEDYRLIRCE